MKSKDKVKLLIKLNNDYEPTKGTISHIGQHGFIANYEFLKNKYDVAVPYNYEGITFDGEKYILVEAGKIAAITTQPNSNQLDISTLSRMFDSECIERGLNSLKSDKGDLGWLKYILIAAAAIGIVFLINYLGIFDSGTEEIPNTPTQQEITTK